MVRENTPLLSKLYTTFLLLLVGIGGAAPVRAQVLMTMRRLPDTGQTTSFTNTFGEDADYSLHTPYFVDYNNGTVTDTITGLMWQRVDGGEMTIENAEIYCETLTLGGYTDWRLPSAHELFSMMNQGSGNPALPAVFLPGSNAEYWWSSDHQATDANKVWVTNAGGGIGNHPKSETISAGGSKRFHVRAVRDQAPPPSVTSHFTIHPDSTVTDHLTGLIWQRYALADTFTWEQALAYAEGLSLAGHDDWRLPNIKELRSINDESLTNPSISSNIFSNIGARKYWSSTTQYNQMANAWYLDARFGITTYSPKSSTFYLICVRTPNISTPIAAYPTEEALQVYPNPFTFTLRISGLNQADTAFELYNTLGLLVCKGENITQQDFLQLHTGIYYLILPNNGGKAYKLMKI